MDLRLHAVLALTLGAACVPDQAPGGGMTGSSSSSTSTTGEPVPPETTSIMTTTVAPTTTAPTTGTTDATTSPAPTCGDGVIDPDEDCDLGPENSTSGACTMMCNPAVCGDSLLWIDHEECDFGPGNVGGFGGCNPDCTLAPHCGDGQVDPEHEECDLAALNGTGMSLGDDAPCGSSCRWVGRRFFVSSTQVDGDLGGLVGADLYCRNLAMGAGLETTGTFRAWLSDGVDSPLTRFEQIDLAEVPLILLSGRIVADDFAELFALGPRTGISITETGQSLFEERAWTNTSPAGESFSAVDHCGGWTSTSNQLKARVGINALPLEMGPAWETWRDERHWTSVITSTCEKVWRIYCIEDGVEPEE